MYAVVSIYTKVSNDFESIVVCNDWIFGDYVYFPSNREKALQNSTTLNKKWRKYKIQRVIARDLGNLT